ncbi:hypothetical protein [Sulfurisphaera ohwakuensis]|uniref:hypothetical protein n=1 Tax=Sulfurisphaera ohwakuensis TaxID=69656 RepID=UPI0036F25FD8
MNISKSSLYGKAYPEVIANPFNRELTLQFLRRGFEELNIKVEDKILKDAVNTL